jgi:hypothetical protein
MATRTNFLPLDTFVALQLPLREHLKQIGRSITPENFPGICNERIFYVLQESFQRAGADEGSIWILDPKRENLVIAHNTGPHAKKIVGFKQPLTSGIVSMVVNNEQSFAEREVYKNVHHSKALDQTLNVSTYAMIVVPFYFLDECRGVISCVQLVDVKVQDEHLVTTGKIPPGFQMRELAMVQKAGLIIRDLINYNLLKTTIGWN